MTHDEVEFQERGELPCDGNVPAPLLPDSMEPGTIETAANSRTHPGFYTWSVPGKAVSVRLRLDVIDRMNVDIMQGFGALPRRGAEVGGILLGRAEADEPSVVVIENFETVPCEHRRGPSYLLSDADRQKLTEALNRWRSQPDQPLGVVGLFRSNTREHLALTEEDITLFTECCPGLSDVFLLVRPFASRPGVAGFFFREDGQIRSEGTYLEFPFQRRALGGGAAPPPPQPTPAPAASPSQPAPPQPAPEVPRKSSVLRLFPTRSPGPSAIDDRPDLRSQTVEIAPPEPAALLSSPAKPRRNFYAMLPLSFIFLILGVLLGFQAALHFKVPKAPPLEDTCALDLTVAGHGENLEVSWNRNAPAVLAARRGVLHIQDGASRKDVELNPTALRTNSVTYLRTSDSVSFQLEVFLNSHSSVSEVKEAPAR